MTPEGRVEKHLVDECLRLGIWPVKAESLGVGFPDRILFIPGGRIGLVELKAKNGRAGDAQDWRHKFLTRLGFEPVFLNSIEAVDEYLSRFAA